MHDRVVSPPRQPSPNNRSTRVRPKYIRISSFWHLNAKTGVLSCQNRAGRLHLSRFFLDTRGRADREWWLNGAGASVVKIDSTAPVERHYATLAQTKFTFFYAVTK